MSDEPAAKRPRGPEDQDVTGGSSFDPPENLKGKRKVALLVAYNGDGYSGLQKNPDVDTVESTLESAIHQAGGISDDNYGTLQKISWSRAGRTDKGVHALGQIISLKMILWPEPMLERINAALTGRNIRVLDYVRSNNNFCAHTACTSREYEYLLPLSVLGPTACDSGATSAPAASENAACLHTDAEARLRALLKKLEGSHSFHNFTDPKTEPTDKSARRYMIRLTTAKPLLLAGCTRRFRTKCTCQYRRSRLFLLGTAPVQCHLKTLASRRRLCRRPPRLQS